MFTHGMVFAGVLASGVLVAVPAQAQSLCDLVPASAVVATLRLGERLMAVPNTDWGNGCDYGVPHGKRPVVSADASDDTGMDSLALTDHIAAPDDDDQLVAGIGKAAIYTDDEHEPDPATPGGFYRRRSLIFRTDTKIVDFVVVTYGDGPTEAEMVALGKLAAAAPVDGLQDPGD